MSANQAQNYKFNQNIEKIPKTNSNIFAQFQNLPIQQLQTAGNPLLQMANQPGIQNESFDQFKLNHYPMQWNPDNDMSNGQPLIKTNLIQTDVTFNVDCGYTKVGDRVAILGNIDELGLWKIEQAVFLETSAEIFPRWSIKMRLPRNQIIEYKYLIIRFGKQQAEPQRLKQPISQQICDYEETLPILGIQWESLGIATINRRLNTHNKKEINLHDEMNNKMVIEEYLEEKSIDNNKTIDQNQINSNRNIIQTQNKNQAQDYFQSTQNPNNQLLQRTQVDKSFYLSNPDSKQELFKLQDSAAKLKQDNLLPVKKLNKIPDQYSQSQKQEVTNSIQESNRNQSIYSEIFQMQNNKNISKIDLNQAPQNQQQLDSQINALIPKIKSVQRQQSSKVASENLENYEKSKTPISNVERKSTMGSAFRQRDDLTSELKRKEDQHSSAGHVLDSHRKHHETGDQRNKQGILTNRKGLQKQIEKDIFCIDDIQIDKQESIILATFLLPYTIQRDHKTGELLIQKCFHNPTMLYANLENMMQNKVFNFKWIGLVTTLEDMSDQEKDQLSNQFREINAYPIFMTAEETEPYLLFYENILRPLFHNFNDLYNLQNSLLQYWKDFVAVNQKFANKIIDVKNEFSNEGLTKIWIHNNHLIMVPLLVKKQFEQANIGFYCHSPFPSSAHFRVFKYRFEILKSLLHCDLVAFHLFMYARNFIKTCQRLCGLDLEFLRGGYFGINFHGKNVLIRVSHLAIDQNFIQELTSTKTFTQMQNKFQNSIDDICKNVLGKDYQNKQRPIIMSSIDSYHPISGLKHKLLSYQKFLEKYPNYRNKIIFIQFVGSIVQAFDSAEDHQRQVGTIRQMRDDIIRIKNEIHQKFGKSCLIYQESNPPLEKRLALWTETDIIWCSSLKDGLCIQILEYVVCRKLADKLDQSVMVCSEFAGCNEAMRGVLRYNPFSWTGFEEQMDMAMSLSKEDKENNMNLAYNYIKRGSMTKWTEDFLKDLQHSYQPNLASYYLGLNFNSKHQSKKNFNRLMQVRSDFEKLNIENCHTSLEKAKKSVIVIEIEALPHFKFSKNSIPTDQVIEQLHSLLIDNRNTVIIIGNQTKEQLEDWFLKKNNVGINGGHFWLAAESGYLYKSGNKSDWEKLTKVENCAWINQVRKIMSGYTENIDGSFVEERQSCILWNYKNAEQEHVTMFIHDLYKMINKVLEKEAPNTEIIYGNGYLEVKPRDIKKKQLINLLLQKISKNSKIDFIFYLGNDSEDEAVFEFLKSERANADFFAQPCSKYICVLEKKPSEADFYIEDLDSVRPILQMLQTATQARKKNRSYSDLTRAAADQTSFVGQQKMKGKIASIANLSMFINSKISLSDNEQSIPSQGQFIPRQYNNNKSKFGEYSMANHVIEEERESADGSQHNLLLSVTAGEKKKKYLSVEDTQNALLNSQQQENDTGLTIRTVLTHNINQPEEGIQIYSQENERIGSQVDLNNQMEGGQKSSDDLSNQIEKNFIRNYENGQLEVQVGDNLNSINMIQNPLTPLRPYEKIARQQKLNNEQVKNLTKFPFYDGLADKSIEINNKDQSNEKLDIKNSENYKGGFFDVPIQPLNLGSVRRESEFESFHKNSMNEQSMVSGPQILIKNQNINKGDGMNRGIDEYSVGFDPIANNQNFYTGIDSTSAQLPSRAHYLAQEDRIESTDLLKTDGLKKEESNPVQLMILHKDKFPHCLSEIGLNSHNENGNFENLALQQFGGCGSVQECQTQQMKGGNNMMLIESSSWTFNKDMQLQENGSSQLNLRSNKKDLTGQNAIEAAINQGMPAFTEKTLSINIMNSQFSLEDIDQSPAKILNASDQNLVPKAAVDQQQKNLECKIELNQNQEEEKEIQKKDPLLAKIKSEKISNNLKNAKESFISSQSISSKRNIFKMMLKQDKDEEAVNVDDDQICDNIQDDDMNFQDNQLDKSFGNSNGSGSP